MNEQFSDISFSKKVDIYSEDFLKCCVYIKSFGINTDNFIFTKKLYSMLIANSQLLEDFLDFHGAKNNKNWFFYRELTAAIRHISLAGYSQQHISNRLLFYDLDDIDDFQMEGENATRFITYTLMKLAPVIVAEAQQLQITIPKANYTQHCFPGVLSGEMLEFDIDDENIDQQEKNIVKIASEFLKVAKDLDQFGIYQKCSNDEIQQMVPLKVNEVEIRRFEMLVHNLQSSFDSYVIHGGYRYGNRKLKQLRGHFSVVFHLLQIIGRLLHFYERHIHEVGYKEICINVKNKLVQHIDPDQMMDVAINYGLYYAYKFLTDGKNLAKEILNQYIERGSICVGIPVTRGFHARPSLMVAKIVEHYGGQVEMCIGGDRFDASSVLDIQWAGGKIQKENITQVVFEGDVRAISDIKILASVNYGEDSMGKGIPLPDSLKYLR
ncbi:MAG: HPr family phosphocarrier protein [Proteobacteria bacterium]|nr:HPr family phosphocarrier protein [Pseudomonadota bacterium]